MQELIKFLFCFLIVEKALEKSGAFLSSKCQVNDGKNLTFHLQKSTEITIFKQLKIKNGKKKVVVKEADSKF
jgi:hypothetical protein